MGATAAAGMMSQFREDRPTIVGFGKRSRLHDLTKQRAFILSEASSNLGSYQRDFVLPLP